MTPPASTEPMPKVNIHRNFMVEFSHHKKVKPDENYPDGDYRIASGWLSQKHPYGYNIDYFETRDDAISAIERCNKENPQDPGYWLTYIVYSLTDVTRARGVAQQAPAAALRCNCEPKAKGNDTDPEMCKTCLEPYQRVGCSCLEMHDAALIAQEREKWERERAELIAVIDEKIANARITAATQALQEQRHRVGKKLIEGICDPNGDCAQCILCDNAGGCLADGSKQVQIAAAQAREDVLDEMRDLVRNAKKYGTIEPEELFHWTGIIAMIDSLRSEVKKP